MPARDEMCRAYSLYMLLDIMMKLHVLPVPPSNNLGGGGGGGGGSSPVLQHYSSNAWLITLCKFTPL